MQVHRSNRAARLEQVARFVLGAALIAAVVWAVTDGGASWPLMSAGPGS